MIENIYSISCGSHVKIGISTDVSKRITSIQTGNPHRISVIRVLSIDVQNRDYSLKSIEGAIHYKLEQYKTVGEWFVNSDDFKRDLSVLFDLLVSDHCFLDDTSSYMANNKHIKNFNNDAEKEIYLMDL